MLNEWVTHIPAHTDEEVIGCAGSVCPLLMHAHAWTTF